MMVARRDDWNAPMVRTRPLMRTPGPARKQDLSGDAAEEPPSGKDVREKPPLDPDALCLLFADCPDAVLVLDGDHRITFWNRGAADLYGWTAAETLGQVAPVLLDTESPIPSVEARRRLEVHGQWRGQLSHRTRSGERIWVDSQWSLRRGGPGSPAILQIDRDITESRRAEEEVAALHMRLQRAMAETHHRVRNNLQIVAAMVDLQLAEAQGTVPEQELRRLGTHVRALAALHEMMTHQARSGSAVQSVSSVEVFDSVLPLLQSTAGRRQVRGTSEADVQLSLRQSTSLALVMNELVNNAVKYGAGTVDVRLQARNGRAVLTVTDEGAGFPSGFGASPAATTGLMLVENLSRWDLGGSVRYDCRPEGGARVIVEFPVALEAVRGARQ